MIQRLIAIACVAGAAGCGGSSTPPAPSNDAAANHVTKLADTYVNAYYEAFPYQAVETGAPDVHPDQLVDHSLPALARWQQREDAMLAELKTIDLKTIEGRTEAITYKFLQNQLEASRDARVCRTELWNVSPTYTGWQADFPVVAGLQAATTEDERGHALKRFSQLPAYLDTEIENLREGIKLGYTAPKVNVAVVISQMDALLAAKVDDSPFVQMAKPGSPAVFKIRLADLEMTSIRPAIAKYRDFLKDTYLAAAREAVGVNANPNGAECYLASVRLHATVILRPREINDLGLAQMEKIQAQMTEIGAKSFGTADPVRLMTLVKTDPKYRFKSREELIHYAEAAVERARQGLTKMFARVPKAPVIVEPYPAFLEKSAPGGQSVPPTADGKPGKYLINAYNATDQSKAGLESTAFHETYPGHHMQGAVALERQGLHPILKYFFLSGFGEGWALYSERLADEMGLFSGEVDRVGLLSNEAFRAARLVVDSGMHGLGWSRQQAVDYMLTHTASNRSFVEAEVNRYIAVPGQATSYMIGNLEIRKLRTESEQALGAKFDIRGFHDLVLEDGALPLWVLREKVARWVKEKR